MPLFRMENGEKWREWKMEKLLYTHSSFLKEKNKNFSIFKEWAFYNSRIEYDMSPFSKD